jgi:antibiotic biosynthesis monooxygenase (ABM) superfamily enzyme
MPGTILTNKMAIKSEARENFANWQSKFHSAIAKQRGFVSLELLSPTPPQQSEWMIIQRFSTPKDTSAWHRSLVRQELMEELSYYAVREIRETFSSLSDISGGVTEVFITQINPENEKIYCDWIAKVHQIEAKFLGFRGVYVQSPAQSGGVNWITLLQFDTPENLDRWLNSAERKQLLEEAKTLISSLESHRMVSPYAGWFSSIAKEGRPLPIWKQTMVVLLVLFPIVMLELKYLSPITAGMNSAVATFIGNTISVALISWPMMPIAIFFLRWWLVPKQEKRLQAALLGTAAVILLYLLEIAIFWRLL